MFAVPIWNSQQRHKLKLDLGKLTVGFAATVTDILETRAPPE
jgi:hypothetical protein